MKNIRVIGPKGITEFAPTGEGLRAAILAAQKGDLIEIPANLPNGWGFSFRREGLVEVLINFFKKALGV